MTTQVVGAIVDQNVFEILLKENLPDLHKHLANLGVSCTGEAGCLHVLLSHMGCSRNI